MRGVSPDGAHPGLHDKPLVHHQVSAWEASLVFIPPASCGHLTTSMAQQRQLKFVCVGTHQLTFLYQYDLRCRKYNMG